jgi:lipoate-protein ligase A
MEMLRSTLRKDTSCYKTRAVNSNPSSVTNLNGLIPSMTNVFEFRDRMMEYLKRVDLISRDCHLSDDERTEINTLAGSKYRSWEWNFAYGPDYQFIKQFEYQGIIIDCKLNVVEGIIKECSMKGNILFEKISRKLTGIRHLPAELKEVFLKENVRDISIFNFF